MAGGLQLELVERESEKTTLTREHDEWQWNVQFARCFIHPPSYNTITTSNSLLCPIKNHPPPIWISSSGPSTVALHPSADGSSSDDSIITVSLQGTIIEEHFISKLHFIWPQVSCLSGFPPRGSLVVLASYADSSEKKQKFALRFSGVSEVQDFMTSLEDILLNKIPNGPPSVDVMSAISSQSDCIPPYRPDISSVMNPMHDFTSPNSNNKDPQDDSLTQDTVADSQSNFEAYPPRFTSFVSSCSAEHEQGKLALALAAQPQTFDLKSQISKYMQDASFVDIVNQVNEVISELGGDFVM